MLQAEVQFGGAWLGIGLGSSAVGSAATRRTEGSSLLRNLQWAVSLRD